MENNYLYFATLTPCEEGGYTVTFSDLQGCITEGDTLEECISNAKEALELHLYGMWKDGDIIPKATEKQNIVLEEDQQLQPIEIKVDFRKIKRRKEWAGAIGLSQLDGKWEPNQEYMDLVEREINGEITTTQMIEILKEKYTPKE